MWMEHGVVLSWFVFSRHVIDCITLFMILGIAYKSIVLGAWGCGAFGNDGREIAELFYRALERNFKASRARPTRTMDTSGDAFRAMHHSSHRDTRESFHQMIV